MKMLLEKFFLKILTLLSAAYLIVTMVLPETQILLWITATLIVFNYGVSLAYLFRQGTMSINMMLLNIVQLALFCRLHVFIHDLLGAEHYIYAVDPRWYDWVELVAVHVLRAVDILDALGAYGIHLQNVKHQSTLAGVALFSMHIMVDIFLLGAIIMFINQRSASQQASTLMGIQRVLERFKNARNVLKEVRFLGLGLAVVLIIVIGKNNQWHISNWWLWPLDNILRTLDFGDAFQIFDWQLHSLTMGFWLATLAVFFRLMVSFYAFGPLNRFYLFLLGGRGKTIEELVKIGISLESSEEEKNIAFKALARFGTPAISFLIEALTHSDSDIRRASAEALGDMGSTAKPAIHQLVIILVDNDGGTRTAAAYALKQIDFQWWQSANVINTIPHLVAALIKGDEFIRRAATEALEKIDPDAEKTLPHLVKALTDNDVSVRRAAVIALEKIGHLVIPVASSLVKALVDSDGLVRHTAADALTNMGATAVQAIPLLVKTLTSNDDFIRSTAANALGNMAQNASQALPYLVKALVYDDGLICDAAEKALVKIDPSTQKIVPLLTSTLTSANPYVRQAAVEILGEIGLNAAEALPHLIRRLADNNSAIVFAVIETLEKIGLNSPEIVPHLVTVLDNPDESIRYKALFVLEKMGSTATDAIPRLVIALSDSNQFIHSAVVDALTSINSQWSKTEEAISALPLIVKTLVNGDSDERCAAAKVLGQMGVVAAKTIPQLINVMADSDIFVCQAIIEALTKIAPQWLQDDKMVINAIRPVVKALNNRNIEIRYTALEILEEMGDTSAKAIPYLIIAMIKDEDASFRVAVTHVLETIDPRWHQSEGAIKAIPHVAKVLNAENNADLDTEVRCAAIEVLEKIGQHSYIEIVHYLVDALTDVDSIVRLAATRALGNISFANTTTVEFALITALSDQQNYVRRAAAESLGNIGTNSAMVLSHLEKARTDRVSSVRLAAERSLDKIQH